MVTTQWWLGYILDPPFCGNTSMELMTFFVIPLPTSLYPWPDHTVCNSPSVLWQLFIPWLPYWLLLCLTVHHPVTSREVVVCLLRCAYGSLQWARKLCLGTHLIRMAMSMLLLKTIFAQSQVMVSSVLTENTYTYGVALGPNTILYVNSSKDDI